MYGFCSTSSSNGGVAPTVALVTLCKCVPVAQVTSRQYVHILVCAPVIQVMCVKFSVSWSDIVWWCCFVMCSDVVWLCDVVRLCAATSWGDVMQWCRAVMSCNYVVRLCRTMMCSDVVRWCHAVMTFCLLAWHGCRVTQCRAFRRLLASHYCSPLYRYSWRTWHVANDQCR